MKVKHEIYSYTIDDHPSPEKVYDWIRNHWNDLGEFDVDEFVQSFKALAKYLGTTFDYSVSIVPYHGEFLRLGEFDESLLDDLNADDFPLTGMNYDYDLIQAAKEGSIGNALLALHSQGEWIYSDEGVRDLCEANEYQFLESGEFYK